MPPQREPDPHHASPPPPGERILLFELGSCHHAIRSSLVAGLAECGELRPVPGAPPAVAGLAEWRGHLLTVLDLERALAQPPGESPPCLVRLAPPLQHTALRLRSTLRPAFVGGLEADDDRFVHEGVGYRLVDPARLVCRLENEIRERA